MNILMKEVKSMNYLKIDPINISDTIYNAIKVDYYALGGYALSLVYLQNGIEEANSMITTNLFSEYNTITLDEEWFDAKDAIRIRQLLMRHEIIDGDDNMVQAGMKIYPNYDVGPRLKQFEPEVM